MRTLTELDVRVVAEAAGLAPSVHNTQPWRFVWDGRAFEVVEDAGRGLAVIDPEGRERLISCGAASLNAGLALAELGVSVGTEIAPDPARPELVARLTLQGAATASPDELALAHAVPRRYTDRTAFDAVPVPEHTVQRLRAAAEAEGAWLRVVESEQDHATIAVLVSHAEQYEEADPAYRQELERWRTGQRETEGIPDAAVAVGVPHASDVQLRDFTPGTAAAPAVGLLPAERPLVVVLGTDGDSRQDWIVAGRALGRVLLQATVDDLAASPLTQVIEVEPLRQRLRTDLGLVGWPQVVLRIGHGTGRTTTRRRPLDEVLELV